MFASRCRPVLAAVVILFAQVASAQSLPPSAEVLLGKEYRGPKVATPRDAEGKPLLTGYWKLLHETGKPDGNLAKDQPNFRLPYSQKGQQVLQDNLTKVVDPEARCIITGIPRLLTSVLPFEILQTPKRLGTFHQLSWHRWVWLDGRKLEDDPDPEYLGNAVGRWEGDTTWVRADEGLGQKEYACNESNLSGASIGPGAGVIGPDGNRGFGYSEPLPDVPPGPEAYENKE